MPDQIPGNNPEEELSLTSETQREDTGGQERAEGRESGPEEKVVQLGSKVRVEEKHYEIEFKENMDNRRYIFQAPDLYVSHVSDEPNETKVMEYEIDEDCPTDQDNEGNQIVVAVDSFLGQDLMGHKVGDEISSDYPFPRSGKGVRKVYRIVEIL